jgi:N-acetylmuramoyl-L-alanine amidase
MRRTKALVAIAVLVWLGTALPAHSQSTVLEKTVNLDESNRLANRLRAHGLTVIMTRTGDSNPSVAQRGRMGREGDLLISVHNNSSTSSAARGTEVYAQVANGTSLQLARKIHDGIVTRAGTPARGVKRRAGQNGDYYGVLRNSPVPAVIVEGAFLSNPGEARLLSQPEFRQRVADGIADGVLAQFVTSAPKGSGPPTPAPRLGNQIIAAPVGLQASTAGRDVHLSWQPNLATVFEVWRDGHLIGTTPGLNFVDRGAPFGGHHYDVRAVLGSREFPLGESPTAGVDVALGRVVIDPGHGGSDSGAVGRF